MSRRLLVLLLAVAAASPLSAQNLTSFAATGPKDGAPSNLANTLHLLSTDPTVLALVQFNVVGANSTASAVDFRTGNPLPLADISPANPYYLSLDGGAVLGGGNLSPDALASYFGSGSGAGSLPGTPSGSVPSLAMTLKPPADGKAGSLSYTASDADGSVLGGSTLAIPADGWWVLGFGAIAQALPDPLPVDPLPSTVDPTATPTPGGANGPPQVPEPATLLLAGIGLTGAALTRRVRRRVD